MIPKLWKRKHFEDFEYINVQLNPSQLIWVYSVTILLSILILGWGILNEFEQED